ncbi:MAG: hypothetical protein JSS50_01780 [Proteobacteria bacterium]|nr:hypothetical protein [Pseudomonadota bacterium]
MVERWLTVHMGVKMLYSNNPETGGRGAASTKSNPIYQAKKLQEELEKVKRNDPTFLVWDLSQYILTAEHLTEIAAALKNNTALGYIKWDNFTDKTSTLYKQINKQLEQNNLNYRTHPKHMVLGLLSAHANLNSWDQNKELVKFNEGDPENKSQYNAMLDGWRIEDIQSDEKSGYYGVMYINDKRHWIVLAHQGFSFGKGLYNTTSAAMRGEIDNPVMFSAYQCTKKAVQMSLDKHYSLSITGHGLGGWFAMVSHGYCVQLSKELEEKAAQSSTNSSSQPSSTFKWQEVQSVVFDTPGAEMLSTIIKGNVKLSDLDITVYLPTPNLLNMIGGQHLEHNVYYVPINKASTEAKSKSLQEASDASGINYIAQHIASGAHGIGSVLPTKSTETWQMIAKGLNMIRHANSMAPMLEQFDPETGLPQQYRRVAKWPQVKYKDNPKGFSLGTHAAQLTKDWVGGDLGDVLYWPVYILGFFVKKPMHATEVRVLADVGADLVLNNEISTSQMTKMLDFFDEEAFGVRANLSEKEKFEQMFEANFMTDMVDPAVEKKNISRHYEAMLSLHTTFFPFHQTLGKPLPLMNYRNEITFIETQTALYTIGVLGEVLQQGQARLEVVRHRAVRIVTVYKGVIEGIEAECQNISNAKNSKGTVKKDDEDGQKYFVETGGTILSDMRRVLVGYAGTAPSPVVVMTSCSGAGKTTVARYYSKTYQNQSNMVQRGDICMVGSNYKLLNASNVNKLDDLWNKAELPVSSNAVEGSTEHKLKNYVIVFDNVQCLSHVAPYIKRVHEYGGRAIVTTQHAYLGYKLPDSDNLSSSKNIDASIDELNWQFFRVEPMDLEQSFAYIAKAIKEAFKIEVKQEAGAQNSGNDLKEAINELIQVVGAKYGKPSNGKNSEQNVLCLPARLRIVKDQILQIARTNPTSDSLGIVIKDLTTQYKTTFENGILNNDLYQTPDMLFGGLNVAGGAENVVAWRMLQYAGYLQSNEVPLKLLEKAIELDSSISKEEKQSLKPALYQLYSRSLITAKLSIPDDSNAIKAGAIDKATVVLINPAVQAEVRRYCHMMNNAGEAKAISQHERHAVLIKACRDLFPSSQKFETANESGREELENESAELLPHVELVLQEGKEFEHMARAKLHYKVGYYYENVLHANDKALAHYNSAAAALANYRKYRVPKEKTTTSSHTTNTSSSSSSSATQEAVSKSASLESAIQYRLGVIHAQNSSTEEQALTNYKQSIDALSPEWLSQVDSLLEQQEALAQQYKELKQAQLEYQGPRLLEEIRQHQAIIDRLSRYHMRFPGFESQYNEAQEWYKWAIEELDKKIKEYEKEVPPLEVKFAEQVDRKHYYEQVVASGNIVASNIKDSSVTSLIGLRAALVQVQNEYGATKKELDESKFRQLNLHVLRDNGWDAFIQQNKEQHGRLPLHLIFPFSAAAYPEAATFTLLLPPTWIAGGISYGVCNVQDQIRSSKLTEITAARDETARQIRDWEQHILQKAPQLVISLNAELDATYARYAEISQLVRNMDALKDKLCSNQKAITAILTELDKDCQQMQDYNDADAFATKVQSSLALLSKTWEADNTKCSKVIGVQPLALPQINRITLVWQKNINLVVAHHQKRQAEISQIVQYVGLPVFQSPANSSNSSNQSKAQSKSSMDIQLLERNYKHKQAAVWVSRASLHESITASGTTHSLAVLNDLAATYEAKNGQEPQMYAATIRWVMQVNEEQTAPLPNHMMLPFYDTEISRQQYANTMAQHSELALQIVSTALGQKAIKEYYAFYLADIGHAYLQLGYTDKATQVYEYALGLVPDTDRYFKIQILEELANAYQQMGGTNNLNKAMSYWEQVKEDREAVGDEVKASLCDINIAAIKIALGSGIKVLEGIEMLNKSLVKLQQMPQNLEVKKAIYKAKIELGQGHLVLDWTHQTKGLKPLEEALELAKNIYPAESKEVMLAYYHLGLAKAGFERPSDLKIGIEYLEKAKSIGDKLYSKNPDPSMIPILVKLAAHTFSTEKDAGTSHSKSSEMVRRALELTKRFYDKIDHPVRCTVLIMASKYDHWSHPFEDIRQDISDIRDIYRRLYNRQPHPQIERMLGPVSLFSDMISSYDISNMHSDLYGNQGTEHTFKLYASMIHSSHIYIWETEADQTYRNDRLTLAMSVYPSSHPVVIRNLLQLASNYYRTTKGIVYYEEALTRAAIWYKSTHAIMKTTAASIGISYKCLNDDNGMYDYFYQFRIMRHNVGTYGYCTPYDWYKQRKQWFSIDNLRSKYPCYNEVISRKMVVPDSIDDANIKAIRQSRELYFETKKALSAVCHNVFRLSAKGDWSDPHFTGVNWGVLGYTSDEYLTKQLRDCQAPKEATINVARMVCFQSINFGIMSACSSKASMACATSFMSTYPEVVEEVANKHPQLFVDYSVVEACQKHLETAGFTQPQRQRLTDALSKIKFVEVSV